MMRKRIEGLRERLARWDNDRLAGKNIATSYRDDYLAREHWQARDCLVEALVQFLLGHFGQAKDRYKMFRYLISRKE